ncbi:MAG: acyl carrier protein [Lachnospiraceae bacterium]|nr:acyl carrier protein [Lachnospiraceae bacterium]
MDIKDKVVKVLCEVNPRIWENLESDLLEEGMIDSFEIVNIVMELEEAFDMEIDPEEITPDNFKTVAAIVDLIKRNLQ